MAKGTIKTYVDSNRWIIKSVERHIRNYCFTHDNNIHRLDAIGNGWIMKTLYIELESECDNLLD